MATPGKPLCNSGAPAITKNGKPIETAALRTSFVGLSVGVENQSIGSATGSSKIAANTSPTCKSPWRLVPSHELP